MKFHKKIDPSYTETEILVRDVYKRQFVVWSSIYRLDFINSNHIRFTPGMILTEDRDFTIRAYMLAKLVATSPEPNYAYRINRPGSILTTINAQKKSYHNLLVC